VTDSEKHSRSVQYKFIKIHKNLTYGTNVCKLMCLPLSVTFTLVSRLHSAVGSCSSQISDPGRSDTKKCEKIFCEICLWNMLEATIIMRFILISPFCSNISWCQSLKTFLFATDKLVCLSLSRLFSLV
jgi:hypothetical protein